jgi:RimJ/RimL family protein N-acetyltransferase
MTRPMSPKVSARSGRTERLSIEPLVVEDAGELFAALDHPDVGTYLGGPVMTTVEALCTRIGDLVVGSGLDNERWLNWVVRLTATDEVVGRLEATVYDGGEWGEVAYVFDPRRWGHGYAVESAGWMIDHLRSTGASGATELWAAIHPDNTRSVRLIERLGFIEVAPPPARPVGSYDDGDLLFIRRR